MKVKRALGCLGLFWFTCFALPAIVGGPGFTGAMDTVGSGAQTH